MFPIANSAGKIHVIYWRTFAYIYIYIYIYICVVCVCVCVCVCVVPSISFQTFFVQAFEIVVDSWKFTIVIAILWDDWPIFMITDSNEQLQQQMEYTLLKPDCHSRWISKVQFEREDTLEERYAIKFYFKLGKNATETYGMLQDCFWSILHESSISLWVA